MSPDTTRRFTSTVVGLCHAGVNDPRRALPDLIPVADTGAGLPACVDGLQHLVAAWLLGFASKHPRRAYSTDLDRWFGFCADHGLDPLTAIWLDVGGDGGSDARR